MKFKRFFVLLIASSSIMHASFKSAEQKLTSVTKTINPQTGRPCLCDPKQYADLIKSNPEVAKMRLFAGSLNDEYRVSPLLFAAQACSAHEVEEILNSHLADKLPVDDYALRTFKGERPYSRSTSYLDNNMLHLISFRTDWTSPEDLAAFERMVKTLTANGVDINQANFAHETPLSMNQFVPTDLSLPRKQQERARILIDNGAQTQWWFGEDPLSQAEKAAETASDFLSQETIIHIPNNLELPIGAAQLAPAKLTEVIESYLFLKYPYIFKSIKIAEYAQFLANYTPNTCSPASTANDTQPSASIKQGMLDFENAKTKEALVKLYERISQFRQTGCKDITKEVVGRYMICDLIQNALNAKRKEEQQAQVKIEPSSEEIPWYTQLLEHVNNNTTH